MEMEVKYRIGHVKQCLLLAIQMSPTYERGIFCGFLCLYPVFSRLSSKVVIVKISHSQVTSNLNGYPQQYGMCLLHRGLVVVAKFICCCNMCSEKSTYMVRPERHAGRGSDF